MSRAIWETQNPRKPQETSETGPRVLSFPSCAPVEI